MNTKALLFKLLCHNISFYEHPPTHRTYLKCHSVTIHILWMVHGWEVGGDGLVGGFMGWVVEGFMGWVVGGFMGWVGVWWWGGLLEGSWGGCIYSPTHEQLQC